MNEHTTQLSPTDRDASGVRTERFATAPSHIARVRKVGVAGFIAARMVPQTSQMLSGVVRSGNGGAGVPPRGGLVC